MLFTPINWYLLYIIMVKAMAPHSSTLAWRIPWMEEPGGLQSMGSLRVGHPQLCPSFSDPTFTFHFHTLEKEMATHSSVLAWRIPGTVEPGGLPSYILYIYIKPKPIITRKYGTFFLLLLDITLIGYFSSSVVEDSVSLLVAFGACF